MSKRTCQNCLFSDQCTSTHPCRYYSPAEEDSEDAEPIIERGRKQFIREWESYIMESHGSDF